MCTAEAKGGYCTVLGRAVPSYRSLSNRRSRTLRPSFLFLASVSPPQPQRLCKGREQYSKELVLSQTDASCGAAQSQPPCGRETHFRLLKGEQQALCCNRQLWVRTIIHNILAGTFRQLAFVSFKVSSLVTSHVWFIAQ